MNCSFASYYMESPRCGAQASRMNHLSSIATSLSKSRSLPKSYSFRISRSLPSLVTVCNSRTILIQRALHVKASNADNADAPLRTNSTRESFPSTNDAVTNNSENISGLSGASKEVSSGSDAFPPSHEEARRREHTPANSTKASSPSPRPPSRDGDGGLDLPVLIALASLTSRLIGFFKECRQAASFGVSEVADAFGYASQLQGFFLFHQGNMNGPIHSAMAPMIGAVLQETDAERRRRMQTRLVCVSLALLLGLALAGVLLWLGAPRILEGWAPGLVGAAPHTYVLACLQFRVMAFTAPLAGLSGISMAILASKHKYIASAVSPAVSSLIMLALLTRQGPAAAAQLPSLVGDLNPAQSLGTAAALSDRFIVLLRQFSSFLLQGLQQQEVVVRLSRSLAGGAAVAQGVSESLFARDGAVVAAIGATAGAAAAAPSTSATVVAVGRTGGLGLHRVLEDSLLLSGSALAGSIGMTLFLIVAVALLNSRAKKAEALSNSSLSKSRPRESAHKGSPAVATDVQGKRTGEERRKDIPSPYRLRELGSILLDPEFPRMLGVLLSAFGCGTITYLQSMTDLFLASYIPGTAAVWSYATLLSYAPAVILFTALLSSKSTQLAALFSRRRALVAAEGARLTATASASASTALPASCGSAAAVLTLNVEAADLLSESLNLCLSSALPLCAVLASLADPVVRLLFQRRGFTSEAAVAVASMTRGMAAAAATWTLRELLLRTSYSLGDPDTPLRASALAATIKVIVGWGVLNLAQWVSLHPRSIGGAVAAPASVHRVGVMAIPWLTVMANSVTTISMLLSLKKNLPELYAGGRPRRAVVRVAVLLAASAACFFAAGGVYRTILALSVSLHLSGSLAALSGLAGGQLFQALSVGIAAAAGLATFSTLLAAWGRLGATTAATSAL